LGEDWDSEHKQRASVRTTEIGRGVSWVMGARLLTSEKSLRPVAVLQEGDKLRRHSSGAIGHARKLADMKKYSMTWIAISLTSPHS
jgi:hypothetical protein